ncbi:hypothetical protein SAMN05444156_1531 [Verrucomicrobium sp. GAS474]|uniref:hypothetical protein n=1 Tax=Verrucomicrobium sp. GAS474 TaxID=1882831 RepID=UPI00087986D9|nr:hypothetical protein [Verrucomicrobium sp. GAS474]SDU02783.1 hypothetical protein SAMN05444156_1531 [Verrucomicrobium sp. GAS474]
MSSSALLCFALLAAFSLLLTPLRAEEGGQPLALFYPVEEPYLGGFATYGTTKMEEAEAKNAVTFSSEPGKIAGFVRWFAKHVPLPVPTVKGWKGGNVRLQIEEVDGSGPTPVTLAWRGNVDPAELGPVTEANVTIESTTKAVLLPLPDVDGLAVENITGLLIKFPSGGKFVIHRIEIVSASGEAK